MQRMMTSRFVEHRHAGCAAGCERRASAGVMGRRICPRGGADRARCPPLRGRSRGGHIRAVKLPAFARSADEPVLLWPPPAPNLAVQLVSMIPPDNADWRNWHDDIEARDRRIREENARAIAQSEERLLRRGVGFVVLPPTCDVRCQVARNDSTAP